MAAQRRRGIKASVHKLQQALEASGLKTQTALAERIADLEQLENPPRGLVNKMFRGESVDPRSVQRVAVALDVEAWTLYEDRERSIDAADAVDPVGQAVGSPERPTGMPGQLPWIAIATLLAVTAIFIFLDQSPGVRKEPVQLQRGNHDVQAATFVVIPPAAGVSTPLHRLLADALQQSWRQLPAAIAGDPASANPQLVAEKPGVDYVVELRVATRGRWLDLLINIHQSGSMQAVWQSVFPRSASPRHLRRLMNQAAAIVTRKPGEFVATASRDAQRKYLAGRIYLDKARTPDNVRRALTEFESAIRLDSDYPGAHAGLCEALVVEHIRTGEMSRLAEAEAPCARALALSPDLSEALVAQAMLDRKLGRHAQARASLERVLEQSPENVDAAIGMAEVLLGAYARGEDADALGHARAMLEQAAGVEPDFWKIPYQQARFSYMAGNLNTALVRAGEAARLDANPLALSNLGTLQFCAGDFAAAKSSYERAGDQDPESFIGAGQMAAVDYNLGRFDAAAAGFGAAIEKQRQSGAAEDHRLWGNYADALRHADRDAEARQAYATAIALAERHIHDGDGQPMHAVARVYYLAMLAEIDPGAPGVELDQLARLASRSESLDAIYQIYLAIVHQVKGLDEQARALLDAGGLGCPGLALSPDIRPH